MSDRSIRIHESAGPILTPPRSPSEESPGYLWPGMDSPFVMYSSDGDETLGVTEYELLRASARKFDEMQQRVLRLHKALKLPLPPPLEQMDLNAITRDRVPLGSVKLSLAMATVMREIIEEREELKKREVIKEGKTAEAFYWAIILSAELQELRKDLEAVTRFYCSRDFKPNDYFPTDLPPVVPGKFGEGESVSVYGEDAYTGPYEAAKTFAAPEPHVACIRPGEKHIGAKPGFIEDDLPPPPPAKEDSIDSLKGQLKQKQQEYEELNDEVKALRSQLESERSRADKSDEANESLRKLKLKEDKLAKKDSELNWLNKQLEKLQDANDLLENENGGLRYQNQQQKTLIDQQQSFIDQLQRTERDLRSTLTDTQSAREDLEGKADVFRNEINNQKKLLQQKTKELEDEQQSSLQAAAEAKNKLAEVNRLLDLAEQKNAALNSQIDNLKESEDSLKQQLKTTKKQLEQVEKTSEKQLADAEKRFEAGHQKTKDELSKAQQELVTQKTESDKAVRQAEEALSKVSEELGKKNEEIIALKENISIREALEESLKAQLKDIESTLKTVQQEKSVLEDSIKQLKQVVDDKERELKLQKKTSEDLLKATTDDNEKLSKEIADVKKLNKDLEEKLKDFKDVESTLKDEVKKAKQALHDRERKESIEIEHLKDDLEKQKHLLAKEQKRCLELEAAKKEMAHAKDDTDGRIAEAKAGMQESLDKANKKVVGLEQMVKDKDNLLDQSKRALAHKEQAIKDLTRKHKAQVEQYDKRIDEYDNEIYGLKERIAGLEKSKSSSQDENSALQDQLSELQSGKEKLSSQLSELQKKYDQLIDEHRKLSNSDQKTKSALSESEKTLKEAEVKALEKESALQKLQSEYKTLSDKSADQLSEAQKTIADLQGKLKTSEGELAGWKIQVDASEKELVRKVQEIKTANEALGKAEDNIRALQGQVTASQDKIKQLEDELQTSREEAGNAQQLVSEQTKAGEKNQSELEGLKAKEVALLNQLNKAETQRKEAADTIETLKKDFEKEKEQYDKRLEEKTSEYDQMKLDLEKQLAESESGKEALSKEKEADWDQQRTNLEAQIKKLQEDLLEQKTASEAERQKFITNQNALKDQLTTNIHSLKDKEDKFRQLQDQFEETQKLLNQEQEERKVVESRLNDLIAQHKEKADGYQKELNRANQLGDELTSLKEDQEALQLEKQNAEAERDQYLENLTENARTIDDLQSQIKQKNSEITALSEGEEGVGVLSGKVVALQNEVKAIKKERDQKTNDLKNALIEKTKVDQDFKQLGEHEKSLVEKYDQARRELNDQLTQRNSRVSELDTAISEISSEKEKVNKLLRETKAELETVSTQLEEQQNANAKLKSQLKDKGELNNKRSEEIDRLNMVQSKLESEKDDLQHKVDELSEKANELEALQIEFDGVKSDLNDNKSELMKQAADFEGERRTWSNEKSDLDLKIASLETEAVLANKRVEGLTKQYEQSEEAIKSLKQSYTAANDEINRLKLENEHLKNEEIRLKKELQSLQATSSEAQTALQAQYKKVSSELHLSQTALQERIKEVEQLKEDQLAVEKSKADIETRLNKELQTAHETIKEIETAANTKGKELVAKQLELASVQEEKDGIESKLNTAQERVQELQSDLDFNREQLGVKTNELSETSVKLKKAALQAREFDASLRKLEQTERNARHELEVKEAELKGLQAQLVTQIEVAKADRRKIDELISANQALELLTIRTRPLVRENSRDDETGSIDSGYSSDTDGSPDSVNPPEFDLLVQELKNFDAGRSDYLVPSDHQDQLKISLFEAGTALDEERDRIEKESQLYHYQSDELPSQSGKRQRIIEALTRCRNKIEAAKNKYNSTDSESASSMVIDEYLKMVDSKTEMFKAEQRVFESARERVAEHRFDADTKPYESLVENDSDRPNELATRVLTKVRHLQQHSSDTNIRQELDGYAAASLVQSACSTLKNQFQEKIQKLKVQSQDEQDEKALAGLLAYKEALNRMLPGRLPLELARALSPNSRRYLEKQVADTAVALESILDQNTAEHEAEFAPPDDNDPRGISGKRLALSLLDKPEFARDVLSFLNSARKAQSGIEKTWYQYPAASSAWLRDMRQKHGLIDVPTFSELYDACDFDLKKRKASRLVSASVAASEGNFASKKHTTKRQKLIDQVKGCQVEEGKLLGTPEAFRGQSNDGSKLVAHPHREVLDCFKQGTKSQLLDTTSGVPKDIGSYRVYDIGQNTNALFNTFFDGAGDAVVRQSHVTGTRYMQLHNEKCTPPLVFEEKRNKWQVNMANAIWTVDPSLLLDNPKLKIPFEHDAGKQSVQRDWIPVRDEKGNTGILLLQKTKKQPQYFLYEVDSSGELIPRSISDDPVKELQQARFLSQVTKLRPDKRVDVPTEKQTAVKAVLGTHRGWLPKNCEAQAHQLYVSCRTGDAVKAPMETVDASGDLETLTIALNPLRNIIKTKREQEKKSAATLKEYDPERYASFNVDATFNLAGDAFISACQKRFKQQDDPVLKDLAAEQAEFRQGVFKPLSVFQGCELKPGSIASSVDGEPLEGSPRYVLGKLDHVMKVNRDHCTRLGEQMAVLRQTIVQQVSAADLNTFKHYSERQILDQVVAGFENGRLPANCNHGQFANQVANLMLAENDLAQTQHILGRQEGLKRDLKQLAADAPLMIDDKGGDRAAYESRCRKINLAMANCATAQDNIHRSLERYGGTPLTTDVIAKLSFERRAGTVLRENQIEEVDAALQQLTNCMAEDAEDKTMSRVSHKGTGWGKSTILKILTAHAAKLAEGQKDCSVIVCAPVTNQAELDIDLSRFYASKGKVYQRLDLEKDFVKPDQAWWTEETLIKIENIVLGLAPDVPEEDRYKVLEKEGKAPVGISVKDVQILKHLLNALESKGKIETLEPYEQKVVDHLHFIFSVLADSPTFIDEWVSLVIPYRKDDPQLILDATKNALGALPHYELTMDKVIQSHDEYVMSCRRRHVLCATAGTTQALAVMARADNPEDIKALAHTDPYTTQQRFNFWMSKAEPIFVKDPANTNRPELLKQIVSKVGTERSLLVFDGTESGKNTVEKAKAFYEDMKTARKAFDPAGAQKARGMLFYNPQKEMQQFIDGDPRYGQENGATVLPEEEAMMRQEGGAGKDVYFTLEQSEGTNAPQAGPEKPQGSSVGVYIGLIEQGKQGRMDAAAQQVGRLMRSSTPTSLQKLIVPVDMDAVASQCPDSPEKKELIRLTGELEVARQKLVGYTGANQENLNDVQKALVNSPLDVGDSIEEEKKIRSDNKRTPHLIKAELEKSFERRMQQQLDHLKTVDWSRAGIRGDFANDLAKLKELSCKAKAVWVKVAFDTMGSREHNDDTERYEKLLDQAQVRSHVSRQFGKEYEWLQAGCDGVCENLNFSDGVTQQLGGEREQHTILQSFRETTQKLMQKSARRVPDNVIEKSEVAGLVKPEYATQQIERCVKEIESKGLEQVVTDPLKKVRRELYEKSIEARQVLIGRVNELIKAVTQDGKSTKQYIYNLEGLRKIREQALKEITKFRLVLDGEATPKDSQDDLAINLESEMRSRYEQLMDAVTSISVSTKMEPGISKDILADVTKACSKFVKNSNHKLQYYSTNHGKEAARRHEEQVAAGQTSANKKPKKEAGSTAFKASPDPSVSLIVWKTTATKAKPSEVRTFDKDYTFTDMLFGSSEATTERVPRERPVSRGGQFPKSTYLSRKSRLKSASSPDLSGKYDSEKEVRELIGVACRLKKEQKDDEAIRTFCAKPDAPLFKQCLMEWKQLALKKMEGFYGELQDESKAEVDFMTRQSKLMQQFTVKEQ
ncbi:hypothetical protein GZ77_15595 [Endozoicomonas montiporae]|uniref:Uncharacterized protein n=3 Tax=Endozoicomonas montiporae TaxID=1027273 RepID=A0A081N5J6_9GAMM|nr:hypothetical protein [Endozoicomonas montiporae]KEQ13719.1 hypothetical protein GZ77_15595 [Endozoicomonas montiporae]